MGPRLEYPWRRRWISTELRPLPAGNAEKLKGANVFVVVNTFSTLYWTYFQRTEPTTYQHKLTNLVGISFAGIGVMECVPYLPIASTELSR